MVLPLIIGGGLAIGGLVAAFADDDPELVPIPDVVEKIRSGDSQDWHNGVAIARQLSNGHLELNQQVTTLLTELGHAWSGDGADKIAARIQPLADVAHQAALTFEANASNLDAAVHNFDQIKTSMEPMPVRPENLQPGDNAFWQDHEKLINEYNAAAERNLDLYHGYTQHLQSSAPLLNIDHGQLTPFNDAEISISAAAADNQPAIASPGPDHSASKNFSQPPPTGGGPAPDQTAPAPPPSSATPMPKPSSPGNSPEADGKPTPFSDSTTTAGHMPIAGNATPGAPLFSGTGAPAPAAPTGTAPLFGSIGGAPKPGTVGSPGLPGAPGRGTAGAPGGSRLSTPPGSTGARGSGVPLAGAPASGTRDPRGEDVDHERKYGLPVSVFDLDSDGEGPVDPRTGRRAVPPTIGA